MHSYVRILLTFIVAPISIMFLFAAGLTLIFWPLESSVCHSTWGRSGMPVEYGPVMGCQVKTPQGWIPADRYRAID